MSEFEKHANEGMQQSDASEWDFKSNTFINDTLESEFNVKDYTEVLNNLFGRFIELNKEEIQSFINDSNKYGKPILNEVEETVFTNLSLIDVKYIFYSCVILSNLCRMYHAKQIESIDLNFVEVGGGYGTLCYYIHKLAKLFELNVNSYIIFNKKSQFDIQKKYLSNFGIKPIYGIENNFIENTQVEAESIYSKSSYLISIGEIEKLDSQLLTIFKDKYIGNYIDHGILLTKNSDIVEKIWKKDCYLKFPHLPIVQDENRHLIMLNKINPKQLYKSTLEIAKERELKEFKEKQEAEKETEKETETEAEVEQTAETTETAEVTETEKETEKETETEAEVEQTAETTETAEVTETD